MQHYRLQSFPNIILLYVFWTVGLFRSAVHFSVVLSMLLYKVGCAHPIFGFVRHQHDTLIPVAWFGGRASSFRVFNRVHGYFCGIFTILLCCTDELKEEQNSCLRLQSCSVEVLSVSCWWLAKLIFLRSQISIAVLFVKRECLTQLTRKCAANFGTFLDWIQIHTESVDITFTNLTALPLPQLLQKGKPSSTSRNNCGGGKTAGNNCRKVTHNFENFFHATMIRKYL